MTEQNVSLIKLSILLSRFSNMANYNLSSGKESPKKTQSQKAQMSLQKQGPRPPAYRAVVGEQARGWVRHYVVVLAGQRGEVRRVASVGGRRERRAIGGEGNMHIARTSSSVPSARV